MFFNLDIPMNDYSDVDKIISRINQTKSAREARWGNKSPADRWVEKRDKIILFIGRVGWSTEELTNYYLGQTRREWVKKLTDEGWAYRQKTIIGDKTVSRNQPIGSVATIILLTEKGQKQARKLDARIGKRISQANQQQTRHDLIAMWVAVYVVKERTDYYIYRDGIEIWSDQVMRGFQKSEKNRPDISILFTDHDVEDAQSTVLLNIEVERRAKKTGYAQYEFLSKLENYRINEIETLIVTESVSKVKSLAEFFWQSQTIGVQQYFYNEHNKKWWPMADGINEKFIVSAMIGVWDQASKRFTTAFSHNYPDFDDPEEYVLPA
jgi:hypothetical protein